MSYGHTTPNIKQRQWRVASFGSQFPSTACHSRGVMMAGGLYNWESERDDDNAQLSLLSAIQNLSPCIVPLHT